MEGRDLCISRFLQHDSVPVNRMARLTAGVCGTPKVGLSLAVSKSSSCREFIISALNGEKSRFNKERKQRIARRKRTHELLERAAKARKSADTASGLPCEKVRSAPAILFSGPTQRSLTLWPARSRSRLANLYIESSDSFVASFTR